VGFGSEIELPDVPLGAHALRAEAAGHLPAERTVMVSAGGPTAVAVVLKPRPLRKRSATSHDRQRNQEGDLEAPINPYKR
jgi:hypothetical protein